MQSIIIPHSIKNKQNTLNRINFINDLGEITQYTHHPCSHILLYVGRCTVCSVCPLWGCYDEIIRGRHVTHDDMDMNPPGLCMKNEYIIKRMTGYKVKYNLNNKKSSKKTSIHVRISSKQMKRVVD